MKLPAMKRRSPPTIGVPPWPNKQRLPRQLTIGVPPWPAKPHVFEQLGSGSSSGHNDLEMILDIPVQLTVELGRTKMPIKNLLQLAQGSVVELAGMAGEPLDVMINGFLIAQGEVVVVNDKLGIRLTDIITPSERMRRLNR